MMEERNSIIPTLGALLLGGVIGAAVALLMAPQSGHEMRSKIRDRSVELKDKAVGTVEDTRSKAGKALEDITHQTKDRVASLTKRGQEMVEEKKERVREGIESARL